MKVTSSNARLKELLKISGDTQADMVRKTGIEKSAISNYINGRREARQDKLILIANAYNVNPGWLMGLDVPMQSESIDKDAATIEPAQPNTDSKAYIKEYIAQLTEKFSNYSPEEIERAIRVFEIYEKSTPEVRASIELLLGSTPQKP